MNQNITIIQIFHWYTSNDGQWWNTCTEHAKDLAERGITHVYLPPAYKSAWGNSEPGYSVYDLYDLGEFDQKGTIRTKYGTKDEYLNCINEFHKNNVAVIADIVLNHKQGGDEKESFLAKPVHLENRNDFTGEPIMIESFTKFNFPGRKGKYSNFEWNHNAFTGVDEMVNDEKVIYSIQNEYGDKWEDVMEEEFGNYDYLMGADIEYRNESVREEVINWGKWYVETTGIDGFRMDAVKHISPSFIKQWIVALKEHFDKPFFVFSEYWQGNVDALINYLDVTENVTQLLDAPLHYNFYEASLQGNEYDLRTIFDGTLLQQRPEMTVTFVENHDTQPLQSLESPIEFWFKPLAYAIILLRQQGIPLVFYPCIYGACYSEEKDGTMHEINLDKVAEMDTLLHCRKDLAYGEQTDYFDHPNCVGWVRHGMEEKENSGCVVLISNGDDGFKEMEVGKQHAGKIFTDCTQNITEEITINENGTGNFLVKEKSVSVWVLKNS